MRGRRFRSVAGVAALAGALFLTGCGSESGTNNAADSTPPSTQQSVGTQSPSTTPSSGDPSPSQEAHPNGPDCSSVWKVGASLPGDYQGCVDAAGAWVEPQVIKCSVGNKIVRADPNLYGVPGHLIRAANPTYEKNKEYQRVFLTCTG